MLILSKKAEGPQMTFISSNDKIHVNITASSNGPMFVLSDGTQVQFTDMMQYYKIITDNDIFDVYDQTFDLAKFKEKYFVDSDDVSMYNILEVEEYKVDDKTAYRYITANAI